MLLYWTWQLPTNLLSSVPCHCALFDVWFIAGSVLCHTLGFPLAFMHMRLRTLQKWCLQWRRKYTLLNCIYIKIEWKIQIVLHVKTPILKKKTSLTFLNFALFPLNSHCLARICSAQCLEICITSPSCDCLPLYYVSLTVFLNCKSLWIKRLLNE